MLHVNYVNALKQLGGLLLAVLTDSEGKSIFHRNWLKGHDLATLPRSAGPRLLANMVADV